ncbi:DUF2160 domain-containing protein [Chloroflexi bacterium TSY]|nr:DUF2160 domain-containing protein [Chloroflexi bacterium TSY]
MPNPISEVDGSPSQSEERRSFLPIETNGFDRVFISVVIFIALHLIWMRFLEPDPLALPLWWATAFSILVGGVIIRWG